MHHVDYDKQNCDPGNLVTLCDPCHAKTNGGDRAEWALRFRAMLDHEGGAAAP